MGLCGCLNFSKLFKVSLTILTSICGLLYALDTDGFVIPSLEIGDIDGSKTDASEVEASKPASPKVSCKNPILLIRKDKRKYIYIYILSLGYGINYVLKLPL
jgi:hypothetical protein